MIHETFLATLLIVKYLQLLINVHQFVLNIHKHGEKKREYRFRLWTKRLNPCSRTSRPLSCDSLWGEPQAWTAC